MSSVRRRNTPEVWHRTDFEYSTHHQLAAFAWLDPDTQGLKPQQIEYQRSCFTIYPVHECRPANLSQPVSCVPGRRHLWSVVRGHLDFPHVRLAAFGRHAFAYTGCSDWNSLPAHLIDNSLSQLSNATLKPFSSLSISTCSTLGMFYKKNVLYKSTVIIILGDRQSSHPVKNSASILWQVYRGVARCCLPRFQGQPQHLKYQNRIFKKIQKKPINNWATNKHIDVVSSLWTVQPTSCIDWHITKNSAYRYNWIWRLLTNIHLTNILTNIRLKTELFERSYNWHRACQTTLLLRDSLSLSCSFLLWLQPWSLSTIMLLWHSFLLIIIIIIQNSSNKGNADSFPN